MLFFMFFFLFSLRCLTVAGEVMLVRGMDWL